MTTFMYILLIFLVVCAIAASASRNLLNTILIFMSYSLIMSIIWILIESPDLAITEAAVGAGVTTVLFLVTLKKIRAIIKTDEEDERPAEHEELPDNRGRTKGITVLRTDFLEAEPQLHPETKAPTVGGGDADE